MKWMLIIYASAGSGYALDHIPMQNESACIRATEEFGPKRQMGVLFWAKCLDTQTGAVSKSN